MYMYTYVYMYIYIYGICPDVHVLSYMPSVVQYMLTPPLSVYVYVCVGCVVGVHGRALHSQRRRTDRQLRHTAVRTTVRHSMIHHTSGLGRKGLNEFHGMRDR